MKQTDYLIFPCRQTYYISFNLGTQIKHLNGLEIDEKISVFLQHIAEKYSNKLSMKALEWWNILYQNFKLRESKGTQENTREP